MSARTGLYGPVSVPVALVTRLAALAGVRRAILVRSPTSFLRPLAPPHPSAVDPPMAAPVATAERLGDLLVREGLITREQLDKALQEQKQSGTRVGYNLVKLGFIQETDLTKMLARQYKMPAVDLSRFEVDPRIAKLDSRPSSR